MKKVLILVLAFTFLFGMVGCDPGSNHLDKDELIKNTVKIELVNYENESPELLRLAGKKQPHFDFNKATLIATLDESHFEGILNHIAEYDYLIFETALNEPMGKTLVLYQSNGNVIVLFGCIYTDEKGKTFYYGDCYEFDENGVLVAYIGDVGYLFTEQIESEFFQNNQ